MLTGKQIAHEVASGNIIIDGFDAQLVNPNSYNLRLADKLLRYTAYEGELVILDPRRRMPTHELTIPDSGLVLQPGTLYLGSTIEMAGAIRNFVPKLEGRSSIGRLGLFIHITAGFGDVGFVGNWTLELTCIHPVIVYPGMSICQISFLRTEGEQHSYDGKYQGATGVEASKLYKEAE